MKLRLTREAQALAQLQHPNVVAVHDVETAPDRRGLIAAAENGEGHVAVPFSSANRLAALLC